MDINESTAHEPGSTSLTSLTCGWWMGCTDEMDVIHYQSISYPESSGFLVSGKAPGETLENSKKFKFFD